MLRPTALAGDAICCVVRGNHFLASEVQNRTMRLRQKKRTKHGADHSNLIVNLFWRNPTEIWIAGAAAAAPGFPNKSLGCSSSLVSAAAVLSRSFSHFLPSHPGCRHCRSPSRPPHPAPVGLALSSQPPPGRPVRGPGGYD